MMQSVLQRVKKKKKIPPILRSCGTSRCFFLGGVVGRSSSCCQDARTDTLEATRFTELMVMERESDTSTDRWKQREGP